MSTVVDERVVEMQFDNSNFEKNVKTSMSTLAQLKQALNLDSATTSLNNLNQIVSNLDFSSAGNSLNSIAKRLSTLGIVSGTAIYRLTSKAMGLFEKVTSFVTNGIKSGGLSRAMNIENARFLIKGLNGDWNALQEDINYGVQDTAYGFDAAAKVAAQLIASGRTAGDSMKSTLRGISGVAAMCNSSYEDIGNIYTTVASNGKLMTEQLRQFSARGLNASATLANALGVTEAEVNDMVSQGKIDFDMFASAMDSAFGEHAKDANSTFTGAMSNIKAALSRIGQDFYQPLIQEGAPLIELFNTIRSKVNEIHTLIQPYTTGAANTINNLVTSVNKLIKGEDVSKTTAWDTLSSKLSEAGVDVESFKMELVSAAKEMGALDDTTEITSDNFTKSLSSGWLKLGVFDAALEKLVSTTGEVSESQDELNNKLAYYQDIVNKVWRGDYKNAPERYQLLADAGYDYAKVQDLVNKTVDQHALTLEDLNEEQLVQLGYSQEEIQVLKDLSAEAQKSGTDLNTVFEELSQQSNSDNIIHSFINIKATIVPVAKAISKAFKNIFAGSKQGSSALSTFTNTLNTITSKLKPSEKTLENITATFEGLFAAIDLVVSVVNIGLKGASIVLQTVFSALGIGIDSTLGLTAAVGKAIVAFRNWINGVSPFASLMRAIGSILASILQVIGNIIKRVSENEAVQAAVKTAVEKLTESMKSLSEWIEKTGDYIADLISNLNKLNGMSLQDIQNEIWNFFQNGVNSISNFKLEFNDAPSDLIKGFINGLMNNAKSMWGIGVTIFNAFIEKIKDKLGIHSPSKVTEEIGNNVMQGFINGLKNSFQSVVDWAALIGTNIADSFANIFANLNLGDVVVVGSIATILTLVNKLSKMIESLTAPIYTVSKELSLLLKAAAEVPHALAGTIKSLGSSLSQSVLMIATSVKKYISAKKWKIYADSLKTMAAAVAILAGSLVVLSLIPREQLIQGGVAIGGLVLALGLLSVASKNFEVKSIGSIAGILLSLAVSLLILSSATKKFGTMDKGVLGQGLIAVIGIIAALGIFLKACSKVDYSKAKSVGIMFVEIAVGIRLMVKAVETIGNMSFGGIVKGVFGIGFLMTFVSVFSGFIAYTMKEMSVTQILAMGFVFTTIGNLVKTISESIRIVGTMDIGQCAKGVLVLALVMELLKSFIKVSKFAGKYGSQAGSMLFKMAIAIGVLVAVIKAVSSMSADEIGKGISVIGAIEFLFTAIVAVSKFAGKYGSQAGSMLLKMSVAIGILVLVIKACSWITMAEVETAMNVIRKVSILFALIIAVSKLAGENASEAGSLLLKLGASLLLIAAAIAILSILDPADVENGTECIQKLMNSMSIIIASTKLAQDANETLKYITISIAALAAAIALLSLFDPAAVKNATNCLSEVMVCLALVIASTKLATNAQKTMAIMTLVIVAIAGVLAMMSAMDTKNSLANATALSEVLIALSASLLLLSKVKIDWKDMLSTIGSMFVVLVVVGGALTILCQMPNMQNCLSIGTALAKVLTSMSVCLAVLSMCTFTTGIKAAVSLITFVALIGAALVALGSINDNGMITKVIDEAIPAVEKVGEAIGALIGGVFAGFNNAMTDSFVNSITSIANAINTLKVDSSAIKSVTNLCKAVLILGATRFLNSILNIFNFDWPWENSLADNFTELGEAVKAFSDALGDNVDPEKIKKAADCAQPLATLMQNLPTTGGLKGMIFGNKDLSGFADDISDYVDCIMEISNKVGDGSSINTAAIEQLANTGSAFATLQSNLSPMNGRWQSIFGEADLSEFGSQLVVFASCMVNVSNTVGNGVNVEAISTIAKAGKKLAKLQDAIGNNGGFFSMFANSDIGKFGDQCVKYGQAMVNLSAKASAVDQAAINYIVGVSDQLKHVAEVTAEGNIDLTNFYSMLSTLGTKLQTFANKLVNTDWESVSLCTSSLATLADIIANQIGNKEFDLTGFKAAITDLSNVDLTQIQTAFASSDTIAANVQTFVDTILTTMSNGFTNDTTVASSVASLVTNALTELTKGIDTFKTAGESLVNGLKSGITNTKGVATVCENKAKNAANKIKDTYSDFYDAGKYVGQGFCDGIAAKVKDATKEGTALGKAALNAAKAALDENSPSKAMYEVGEFFVEGFSNAISDDTALAVNASSTMAFETFDSMQKALNSGNLDASNLQASPSITPVLDTSNMSQYSWSGIMNGSLGDLSFTEQTQSMLDMCREIQNGIIDSNNKVINAIDELRTDMGMYYNDSNAEVSLYLDQTKLGSAISKNFTKQMSALNKLK